jgi:hypothetical protein
VSLMKSARRLPLALHRLSGSAVWRAASGRCTGRNLTTETELHKIPTWLLSEGLGQNEKRCLSTW